MTTLTQAIIEHNLPSIFAVDQLTRLEPRDDPYRQLQLAVDSGETVQSLADMTLIGRCYAIYH